MTRAVGDGTLPAGWRPTAPPADRLDAVADDLLDLLDHVDHALHRYGVAPGHAIVAGLREFRALPGAVAAAIVHTDPAVPWQAAHDLAVRRSAVLAAAAPLDRYADRLGWAGAGRAAFDGRWAVLSAHLSDGLPASLAAAARHGARLAHWYAGLRAALRDFFLRYGTGPAAVDLRTAPVGTGGAAELSASGTAAVAAADLGAACFAALRPVLADGGALRRGVPGGSGGRDEPVARGGGRVLRVEPE